MPSPWRSHVGGGVAARRARRPSPAPPRGSLEREQAVEGERGAGRATPGRLPARTRAPRQRTRRASLPPCRRSNASTSSPSAAAASAAEPAGSSRPEPTSHASSAALLAHPGDELADLPERHPPLAGALDVRPARRRLRRMPPVEDERIAEVVAVRDREEARPEVVVLALGEGRVVPEPVRVEHLTVDHHRRVEERRREERRPAHGAGTRTASDGRDPRDRRPRSRSRRSRRRPLPGRSPCVPRAARATADARRRPRRGARCSARATRRSRR